MDQTRHSFEIDELRSSYYAQLEEATKKLQEERSANNFLRGELVTVKTNANMVTFSNFHSLRTNIVSRFAANHGSEKKAFHVATERATDAVPTGRADRKTRSYESIRVPGQGASRGGDN